MFRGVRVRVSCVCTSVVCVCERVISGFQGSVCTRPGTSGSCPAPAAGCSLVQAAGTCTPRGSPSALSRFLPCKECPGACTTGPCTRCQLHPNMQLLLLQPNPRLPNTSRRPSGTSTSPTSACQVGAGTRPLTRPFPLLRWAEQGQAPSPVLCREGLGGSMLVPDLGL